MIAEGFAVKMVNHRVHREHRAVPLFSVSSVLSVVLGLSALCPLDAERHQFQKS
ncbi:MAG: hypothetical protein Q8M95_06585 [Candidatus Methanoperedens sp.]|nr:hypothetical protein [Candidatus Methanoperedens sp.]